MISLELESQHGWLLEAVLFLVILGTVSLALKKLPRKTFQWVFPIANALLLTLFTVGCSGKFPFLLEEQVGLFSGLHHFQSRLHQNQSLNAVLGDNRLILIDVSHDLALLPDSSFNATWRANQLITDRQKLAQFLSSLNNSQDSSRLFVDLVVCDLTFGDASINKAQDKALQAAFDSLANQQRILIAKSDLAENKSVRGNVAINTVTIPGGLVDITKFYDGTFFTYKFFDEKKASRLDKPLKATDTLEGLPYLLYKHVRSFPSKPGKDCFTNVSLPKRERDGGFLKSPLFVPDFWIDDEDVSFETESAFRLPGSPSEPDTSLREATGRLRSILFYLGQVTDTDTSEFGGRAAFMEQLRDNYQNCKRTVVFIGLFDDPDRDRHHTLIGPMHGSTLLLNMFINLMAESHLIGVGYLLYLIVGFWGVGYLLIREPYNLPKSEQPEKSGVWTNVTNWLRKGGHSFLQKGIDKRAYLLAFVVLLGAITFFNHLINLIVIGLYITIITEVFNELYHRKLKKHE